MKKLKMKNSKIVQIAEGVWMRRCPECGKEKLYKGRCSHSNAALAERNGSVCNICKPHFGFGCGVKWTDARRKAFSQERSGKGNPAWGRKWSEERCIAYGLKMRGQKTQAKLNEEKVREIRKSNIPAKELAQQYGVSLNNIYGVRSGKYWSWVA